MGAIINIETATAVCSVAVGIDGHVKACNEEGEGRTHSSHLTVFIEQTLAEAGLALKEVDAISVSKGPGSYTGLRIGVSVAKGLCFSLGIPLLAVDTLQSMAATGIKEFVNQTNYNNSNKTTSIIFCPMIDARRMEVYSAVYDIDLNPIRGVEANIVDSTSYSSYLEKNKVVFFGDGMNKCKEALGHQKNAIFLDDIMPTAEEMVMLSENAFNQNVFQDLAYFEPFYLKDFIAGPKS